MGPKKSTKPDKGQQKVVEKQKAKIIEDRTFGLKNKNKSKAVQKYIKEVTQQVKGNPKGGMESQTQKQLQEKEEKKKNMIQQALLASLFRGAENVKKMNEGSVNCNNKSSEKSGSTTSYDPKSFREFQKIDLYVDQRILKNIEGYEGMVSGENSIANNTSVSAAVDIMQNAQTEIVCKYFIEAVEKKQYGWFWNCPNGGDACKYRHCLPQGYILKKDKDEDEEEEELPLEEQIENERKLLPPGGTQITFETFTQWLKNKEKKKLGEILSAQNNSASSATGDNKLSGKDLFAFNPSVFVDDEDAALENDYEEDESYWSSVVKENEEALLNSNKIKTANDIDKNKKHEFNGLDQVIIKKEIFLEDLTADLDCLDDLENENSAIQK